jgi:hypothetical protein
MSITVLTPAAVAAKEVLTKFTLLDAALTNQTSSIVHLPKGRKWFKCSVAGTGAVSATVTWYGNDTESTTGGVLIATSTLSGTDSDSTGADIPAEPEYVYCTLASISGTNAAVTARVSV